MIEKISVKQRQFIIVVIDSLATVFTCSVSFLLVSSLLALPLDLRSLLWLVALAVIARLVVFRVLGVYGIVIRYASIQELLTLGNATTSSSLFLFVVAVLLPDLGIPRALVLIEWMMHVIILGTIRISLRLYRDYLNDKSENVKESAEGQRRILIIGAGEAGVIILRTLRRASSRHNKIIGFVDDQQSKLNRMINKTPILGATRDIPEIAKTHRVDEAIIAIPSASGKVIRRLVDLCEIAKIKYRITPSLYDIISGRLAVNQLRDVRIEDLLGRKVVETDLAPISHYLKEKVVMVTGAGGSIGSELSRQIVQFSPDKIVLLDHSENAVFCIDNELREKHPDLTIIPVVADIKNRARLESVFLMYHPKIVFHAAAYKHVPLMEFHPIEAIENNVKGTRNVLQLSSQFSVSDFVLISTDKAVDPSNCMGASKRLGELLMRIESAKSETKFAAVRFGNVLGSNGSVIPKFRAQIAAGGPITVTHPDMERYFMTIPEAVRLVIQAGALAKGGELFVLDMGDPVKIVNLARDMIRLSGLEEGRDIEIVFSGIRPGEKLAERLFFDREKMTSTQHEKIFVSTPLHFDYGQAHASIDQLLDAYKDASPEARRDMIFSTIDAIEHQHADVAEVELASQ